MRSYIIDLPVIHNAKPVVRLDRHYVSAYRFMVRKWRALPPWPTVIVALTWSSLWLLFRALRIRYKALFRVSTLHPALDHPDVKARELGFDFRAIANVHVMWPDPRYPSMTVRRSWRDQYCALGLTERLSGNALGKEREIVCTRDAMAC
jgi:hypothetical protein